jgi:hypothetical protein
MLLFQVYINSLLALLNARHYLQLKTEPVVRSGLHFRHSVYPPQLYRESQDNIILAFRKLSHPDDKDVHPNCLVQVSWLVVASLSTAQASSRLGDDIVSSPRSV